MFEFFIENLVEVLMVNKIIIQKIIKDTKVFW